MSKPVETRLASVSLRRSRSRAKRESATARHAVKLIELSQLHHQARHSFTIQFAVQVAAMSTDKKIRRVLCNARVPEIKLKYNVIGPSQGSILILIES